MRAWLERVARGSILESRRRGPSDGMLGIPRARDPRGGIRVRLGGREVLVGRAAYELTHGRVPPGLHIRSTCGHRWCCNPGHVHPAGAPPLRIPAPAKLPTLTPQQLDELEARYARGETWPALARLVGLSADTLLKRLARRRTRTNGRKAA